MGVGSGESGDHFVRVAGGEGRGGAFLLWTENSHLITEY